VRQLLVVVLLSLALGSKSDAEGQTPAADAAPASKPLGVELSLRLGPAATNFLDVSGPMFPLWFGMGYRFGGWLYVGLAGVYAFGPAPETIAGSRPNSYNAQFLTEVALHPLGYGKVDPWVGYGLGVEWFNGGTGNFIPVSISFGVNFALARTFRLGPFFAFQVAFNGSDTHNWYVFGLQLTALP
jgi:hypothetical protein